MKKDRNSGSHARRNAERKPVKKRPVRPPAPRPQRSPRRHVYFIAGTVLAVLLIVAAALMIGSADQREHRGYMQQAQESYQAGDYDMALSYLRKAANIQCSEDCLLLMADCYEAQQNYEKALEALRKADTTSPAIAQRIAAIEQLRAELLEAEKISIGGRRVSPDATGLVLDGLLLGDELLSELSQLRSLDNLSLVDNALTDITALGELGGLVTLNLSGNNISDISALARLTGLRQLYLDNNPVKDLTPLLALTNLTTLSIRGININAQQLERLSAALPSCAIHSDASSEDVVDITMGGVTFKSDVRELDLSGCGLRDISALAVCQNLVRLDLSGNEIGDVLALMNIPGLEWLDLSDNELLDLKPLIGLGALRSVLASGNNISGTTSVGAMTALTELDLSNNPISDFSGLKKLRNLETLCLNSVGLSDEGLQYLEYLSSLDRLEIEDNPDMSGEAVDALKGTLGSCIVSHSELLYSVDIQGHSFKANVTELDLTCMGISDISGIIPMNSLETVKLGENSITNIYSFQYTDSRNLIKHLDLSGNGLEDITPLASLDNLVSLDLSNNKLISVQPLMLLHNLRSLDLSGNSLTAEQIQELQSSLTNCEIIS